jgi:hypothetical protein
MYHGRENVALIFLLAFAIFATICSVVAVHLRPQLRIHFIRDGHNVRKQQVEV